MWYNNEWGVILYNSLGTGFEIEILDDKKKIKIPIGIIFVINIKK